MIDAVHYPVLLVVTPLICGLLTALFVRGRYAWWVTFGVISAMLAFALALHHEVDAAANHVVSYPIGWWPTVYGIEYRLDHANSFMLVLLTAVGWINTIYAKTSFSRELGNTPPHLAYALWQLALAGMVGICITGDAFNVYVLLEIASLTVYTLVALAGRKDRRAYVASLRYVVMGSVGATFFLLGIGYLLMLTGTLNMADIHTQLLALDDKAPLIANRTYLTGVAFVLVGIAVKMAAYPLHTWLAGAYSTAPSAVASLLSGTATKVGAYMALRFSYTIMVPSAIDADALHLLAALAGVGLIHSSLQAFWTRDVRRIFALSSVGQLAYVMLAYCIGTPAAMAAALFQLVAHAVAKSGIFMALGALPVQRGPVMLSDLAGLGRRQPIGAALIAGGSLSLVGVPLTVGFVSKWLFVQSAWQAGDGITVALGVLGGVLALGYAWRVIEAMYFVDSSQVDAHSWGKLRPSTEPLGLLLPALVMIGASLGLGIAPGAIIDRANLAAHAWIAGGEQP